MMFCAPVQTLQLSLSNKPARQCLLFVTQTYVLVLTWSSWTQEVEKCSCRHVQASMYHTNHSLRATAATRLYHAGVDEQMVMECTGNIDKCHLMIVIELHVQLAVEWGQKTPSIVF